MTNASYDYLTKSDGRKIKVDAAVRDGDGREIGSFYVRKGQLKTVGGTSLFNDVEGTVQNIPFPVLSRSETGSGNVVTDVTVSGHAVTVTKGQITVPGITVSDTGTGLIVTDVEVDANDNHKLNLTRAAVTNSAPTLSWGSTSKIGTIGSQALTVTMPTNPNTDTKVTQTQDITTTTAQAILFPGVSTSGTAGAVKYTNKTTITPSTGLITLGASGTITSGNTGAVTGGTVYTALQGYVPTTRTVNSKALSSNITLSASDVGALPSDTAFATINGTSVKSNTAFALAAKIKIGTATTEYAPSSGLITLPAYPTLSSLGAASTTQLTDGSVTKIGTATVGGALQPIYLNAGTPTAGTQLYAVNNSINGTNYTTLRTVNTAFPNTFAPTTAGTSGQVLQSAGSGAPQWVTAGVSGSAIGNGQISLTSSRGTAVGSFSMNQSTGASLTLPASSTQYQNVTVTFALQSTPDFSDYPYMASYSVTGLLDSMYASVVYSSAQVATGQFAPFCQTVSGAVRLYAKSAIGTQIIPTISVGMDDSSAQQSMSNYVTLTGDQTINGVKTFTSSLKAADPASGATDKTLVTANWVSQTGDSAPNNLVHRTGDETKNGALDINKASIVVPGGWHTTYASTGNIGDIKLFAKITARDQGRFMDFELGQSSNTAICYGILSMHTYGNCDCLWTIRRTYGANNPMAVNSILIVKDSDDNYYLASRRIAVYGNLMIRLIKEVNYGVISNYSNIHLEWLDTVTNIGDGTGYTLYEAVE